jgi:hypothetical protein
MWCAEGDIHKALAQSCDAAAERSAGTSVGADFDR